MTEKIYNDYISRIPKIVEAKLRDFDPNRLSRPAVPTLAYHAADFFMLPEKMRDEIITKQFQALNEVGIFGKPLPTNKCPRYGWYLYKGE